MLEQNWLNLKEITKLDSNRIDNIQALGMRHLVQVQML